jgi:ribosomal-protein-alanine N-acetyltransferase
MVRMSTITATPSDLRLVRDLINSSVRRQINLGDEDLAMLVQSGDIVIGLDDDSMWGLAAFHAEPRPPTLPTDAPNRVYLRAVAFRQGVSPSSGMLELVNAYCGRPAAANQIIIAYGGDGWYDRALLAARLDLREQVYFYALNDLERRVTQYSSPSGPAKLRAALPEDLGPLAQLDAATFDLIWHMSTQDLHLLLLRGRIELAWIDHAIAGYSATTYADDVAQLARLAVHPEFQRSGLGRQLLLDSIRTAEGMGCKAMVLNTQAHNEHAQLLYESVGFHQTGEHFGVFTRACQSDV